MTSAYTPLPLGKHDRFIRILRILPEPHPQDNRVQCKLIITDVGDWPTYDALSYTWGEPDTHNFQIWVDDVLRPVRRNLMCALRVLRAKRQGDIWIDAICIDQSNVEERNQQVSQMDRIYQKAAKVLTWLGTPNRLELFADNLDVLSVAPQEDENLAFDLLERMPGLFKELRRLPIYCRSRDMAHFLIHDFLQHLNHLRLLCFSPYWKRLWIVQEVLLATDHQLLYGTRAVPWNLFASFHCQTMGVFVQLNGVSSKLTQSWPWALRNRQVAEILSSSVGDYHKFESLLCLTKDSICHDKRDKVYGILGLIQGGRTPPNGLEVDYRRSMFEVWAAVIEFQRADGPVDHILGFSRILLTSLLCPNPDTRDYANMTAQCRAEMQIVPTPNEVKIAFESMVVGEVQGIAISPTALMKQIGIAKGLEKQKLTLNIERAWHRVEWSKTMRLLWKDDHDFFTCIHPSSTQTSPLGDAAPGMGLVMFFTDTDIVGLAPRGVQVGDKLCAASGKDFENIFTIARENVPTNSGNLIVGRAAVAQTRIERDQTLQPDHLKNLLPEVCLFGDHVSPAPPPSLPLIIFPKPGAAESESLRLECTMCEMFLLTCPLQTFEIGESAEGLENEL